MGTMTLRDRRRKKKRRPVLFMIVILGVCVAGLFALFQVRGKSNVLTPDIPLLDKLIDTPVPVKTIKHYYIPVTDFKSLKTRYTLDEIKQSELVTLNENVDTFPDGFEADVINESELETLLTKGKIAILKPSQVKPNYKTLSIDGMNIWDKNIDKENYPLFYNEKRPGEIGDEDNLIQDELTTIFAGGEIIPARAVDRLGLNIHNNYTYLFDGVREDIANADLAIAQLENPLMGDPSPCTGCVVFVGDEKVAPGLKQVGFDILAFSGNHAGDGGQAGYKSTAKLLDENEILYTGMGKGVEEQLKPAIREVNGLRVGMISADEVAHFYWSDNPSVYGINSFSIATNGILTINQDRVNKIKDIKLKNNIDYLIVYESWGVEYTNKANTHQQALAKAFIDNGADIVVASHPHWVQNIEFYKGKPIMYALGNFIFDQTHTLETRQAVVANLRYYKNELKSIELIPLQVCGYHQTKNDLTTKYLSKEITLEDVWKTPESQGCVYWQPRKLEENSREYEQILNRVHEF